ncbi:MAG: GNAT family N-acetyltransferase [Oscillospiraceae bacterium]|nr:GNAT family N-acetyltransferase [Oscillospiraceae bacterium]MCL2278891.1 GNAT family N-acetyltransferase [Oscillospiraceae bacterium]
MHTMIVGNRDGAKLKLQVLDGASALPGFLSCMLSVYKRKDNYAARNMMDEEWLMCQADAGNLLVFSFVRENGDCAVSMAALKSAKFDGLIDLSSLVVNPKYRGFRLGDLMTGYIIQQCEEAGFDLIYSPIVTHHAQTSTMYERHGFTPTGFLFGDCDAAKHMAELKLNSQKLSLAIYIRNSGEKRNVNIFIPENLTSLAQDIYMPLNVSLFIDYRERIPSMECALEHEQDEYHKSLFVYLWRCGNDLHQRINELEAQHTGELQTYHIYLNIKDFHAVNGYKVLSTLGYKFCGFKPLCGNGEFMVMCKMCEIFVDHTELQMSDALTKLFERVNSY